MKKVTLNFYLLIIVLVFNQAVFAQPTTQCNTVFDDFSNPALWSHPVLGTNLQDISFLATMNVSGNQFYLGQSRDNAFNYLTRTGLSINNTNFVADIDFNYLTNGIGAGGAGHTVLALNAGTQPFFSSTASAGGAPGSATPLSLTLNNQKGIAVTYESDTNTNPSFFQFKVYINDGLGSSFPVVMGLPVIIPGPLVPSGSSANYYIRLKRTGTTNGELQIFSDFLRTILIGSSGLFSFPAAINGLNTAQLGTNEWQDHDRMLTGSLDNLCISGALVSQPSCNVVYDNFSVPAIWTHPVLSPSISCPIVYASTMNISANTFNFGQSRDNNMNYFYRSVPPISNSDFTADIDFRHVSNGTSGGGAGHTLLALNDSTKPFFNETSSTGGSPCTATPLILTTPSIQSGIAVTFESNVPVAPAFFEFKVYLNVVGTITPAGTPINVGLANTTYFIRLERTSTTSGQLYIYSDMARTLLVGSSGIFAIPATIAGLNTVDIGTNEWQDQNRMLTGGLKNLCISNTSTLANESNKSRENTIRVYPNPAKNILNIAANDAVKQIVLLDYNGRIILIKNDANSINIDNLTSGIYLLKIETERESIVSKIIKE